MIIENIIILVILGLISLASFTIGLYLRSVNLNFEKNGISTLFEVTSVKKENKLDSSNNKIGEIYLTTFKFTYNNQVLEEVLATRQNIPVGVKLRGKYLPTATINKISVAGEGFSIPSVVPRFLITLGLATAFTIISILANIPYYIVLLVILVLIISFIIINKLSSQKKTSR